MIVFVLYNETISIVEPYSTSLGSKLECQVVMLQVLKQQDSKSMLTTYQSSTTHYIGDTHHLHGQHDAR
jgi:hypothetical protein